MGDKWLIFRVPVPVLQFCECFETSYENVRKTQFMGIKRSVTVSSGVMGMLLFLLVPEETSDVGTPMSV